MGKVIQVNAQGYPVGESNGFSRLTLSQVEEIRKLRADGATLKILSKLFGVSITTISLVAQGKTWVSQPVKSIIRADESDLDAIGVQVASGCGFLRVAKRLGITTASAQRLMREHGLRGQNPGEPKTTCKHGHAKELGKPCQECKRRFARESARKRRHAARSAGQ